MSGGMLSWPITPLMRPHQAGQWRKGERGAGSGEQAALPDPGEVGWSLSRCKGLQYVL